MKKLNSRNLLLILLLQCLLTFSFASSNSKLNSNDFLNLVRKNLNNNLRGEFTGSVQYRDRKITFEKDIEATYIFDRDFTSAKIETDNIIEEHSLLFSNKDETTELTSTLIKKEDSSEERPLSEFGISASILTFSFIYWNVIKEYSKDSYRTIKCRVFDLQNPISGEIVKLWISQKRIQFIY